MTMRKLITPGTILVGHSYGAAVALIAALACPERVRALVLYEPTLFSLVDADAPPPNGGFEPCSRERGSRRCCS